MQLALSSTALPGASIETLRRAARRRDLTALEVVMAAKRDRENSAAGNVGGNSPEGALPSQKGEPPIRWILLKGTPSVSDVLYRARQASLLDAGLLLHGAVPESPLGLPVALLHETDVLPAQKAAAWARLHDATTGWEIDLGSLEEGPFQAVLDVTMPTLAHVRVRGAGPEVGDASGGTGMGSVLKALALRGYSGTLALAPSVRGTTSAWRDWLFEDRGWGCNTAAKKKEAREATRS